MIPLEQEGKSIFHVVAALGEFCVMLRSLQNSIRREFVVCRLAKLRLKTRHARLGVPLFLGTGGVGALGGGGRAVLLISLTSLSLST